jgi:hypothetical protein
MYHAVASPQVRGLAWSRIVVLRWLARHWLPLAAGAAAALPVCVTTLRALRAGWMPLGDQGIVATRAYDVLTSHTPLLGQYSEASVVTGRPTYSPGPLLYWLLALPARVGAPASLTLTMAAVNVASILAIVALARRRGGVVLAIGAAGALALMCISLSSESLHGIFNPSAALFPFALLVFMCWSLACGDYRLLPTIALVASFVTQAHVAYLLPSLGLVVIGLMGVAASRRSLGLPARSLRRWGTGALLVALLCWSAPIVDQVAHHVGNFSALAAEAGTKAKTQGLGPAWRATMHAVGVVPRWLRPPGTTAGHLGPVSGGDYGDTRLPDLWTPASTLAKTTGVLLLAALVLVAGFGARRRRRDLVAGALIGLVLCAALAAVVSETPLRTTNTLGYTLWWGSVAGMWVWLFLAWSALLLVRGRTRLARARLPGYAPLLGVAGVAAAGGAVAAAKPADTHEPFYRPTRDLAAGLDRALAPGRTVRLVAHGSQTVVIEPTIRYTLRRMHVRALGRYASRRPGAWYELDHRRYSYIVSVNGNALARYRPFRVVARTTMTTAGRSYRLTATLSPRRARRR